MLCYAYVLVINMGNDKGRKTSQAISTILQRSSDGGVLKEVVREELKGKIQEYTLDLVIDGCEGEKIEPIFIINRVINFTNKMSLSLSRKKRK